MTYNYVKSDTSAIVCLRFLTSQMLWLGTFSKGV